MADTDTSMRKCRGVDIEHLSIAQLQKHMTGWHIHLEGPDGVLPGEDQTGESGSEVGGWPIETN